MSLYKYDLFISYAHIDNQPVCDALPGWISRFHESLDTLLSMHLGKQVRIWRDDKLKGNDQFDKEIINQFDGTAALISVLTPRYLSSEWCTREVNEFCNRVNESIVVENKTRIFKIVKTPVESEEPLPGIMQQMLGYDFYVNENGVPMALDAVYGQQYGQGFNRQINRLAFEIANLLKILDTSNDSKRIITREPITHKPTVYLAETAYDVKHHRDDIASQLNNLGFKVLPDSQFPRHEEQAYIDAVNNALDESDVSVHIIGKLYGAVPDGPSDESIVCLQNRLAAKKPGHSSLNRLIWIENVSATMDYKQARFIEDLQSDKDAQHGADLLLGDIEDLKTNLEVLLESVELSNSQAQEQRDLNLTSVVSDSKNTLFLLCTEADRKGTLGLRKYLRAHGITAILPAFKGDSAQVRQVNHEFMTTCDVIVVFYGEGEESWKRSVDTELRKLPALLESKPMPKILTYLSTPCTCDKADLVDMEEPDVIDGRNGIQEEGLSELLDLSDRGIHLT